MSFAQEFLIHLSQRFRRETIATGKTKAKRSKKRASAFMLESLESRLLMSATPMEVIQTSADAAQSAAIVSTNYQDYAPGETAVITTSNGTGGGLQFAAGETVRFQVDRTDGIADAPSSSTSLLPAGNEAWFVTDGQGGFTAYRQFDANGQAIDRDGNGMADIVAPDNDLTVNGSIKTSWYVEQQYRDSSLLLTAAGQESGAVATTAFTDANFNTTTAVTSSAVTTVYGTQVVFTATVTSGDGLTSPQGTVSFFSGTTLIGTDNTRNGTGTGTGIWRISTVLLDAGTHSITAVFNGGATAVDTFSPSTSSAITHTVTQRSITGSFTSANKTYDGTAAAAVQTRSLTGVFNRDAADVTMTGGTASFSTADAGIAKIVTLTGATLTGAAAGNYTLASVETTTADIGMADAVITVTGYTGVYDGSAHGATGVAIGVLGETLGGLYLDSTVHTNAGNYTDTWIFANGTGNYRNATGTVTSSIAKATATISVSGYNSVYNGAAQTATGRALGLALGNSPAVSIQMDGGPLLNTPTGITNNSSNGLNGLNGYRYADTLFSADQELQVTLAGAPSAASGHFVYLYLRTQNPNTANLNSVFIGYQEAGGSGSWIVGRYINHSGLTLDVVSGSLLASGDQIRASVVGNTITAESFHNGVWKTEISHTLTGANIVSGPGVLGVEIGGASPEITMTNVLGGNYTGGTALGVLGESLSGLDLSGTIHTNAGTYTDTWTFTNDNYETVSGTVTSTIAKADAVVTVTGYNATYNGAVQQAAGTAVGVLGESLSGLNLSGTTHTNAGTYTDSWTFTNANYNNATGTVTSTIAKANAAITVAGYNVTFDGTLKRATGTATGVGGTLLSGLNLSVATHGNAGTYNDTWTFTDVTGNYNNASGVVTSTIAKANAVVTVTGYNTTYNGVAQKATATVTGVRGWVLNSNNVNLAGTVHTNAGSYTDGWTFTDTTGNYNNATGTVTSTIAKANAAITVTGYDVTFDGTLKRATGTATGVGGKLLSGLNLTGTAHGNAGTYTDTWTFTDVTGNYNNASGVVTSTIAKANAVVTVTGYNTTYNGVAQKATATVTGVRGWVLNSNNVNLVGTVHTNAGTYTDTWTFTDTTGNYNNATGTVTSTIAKANAAITVTGYDVTFDGTLKRATGTATGVGGTLLSGLNLSAATHGNAGTYTDTWTFTDVTGNYNNASGVVTSTIAKANVTVTVTGYTVTFDGLLHRATGTVTGVNGWVLSPSSLDLSGTKHGLVGTYNDTWTFTDTTGNYNNASGTVTNVILPA